MLSALLFLTCCLSAPAEVTITTDTVSLGELIPFAASDPRGMISLGFAPNPGLARRFQKEELLAKIVAAGFSTSDLQLPDTVLVRRFAQTLNNDQAVRAVRDSFIRQYPGANIEIVSVEVPETQVGAGNVDVTAMIPPHSDPAAPIYVKLDLRGTNFVRAIYVRTVARVELPQPVIVRPIAAQSRIQPDDVEWKPMPVRGNHDVITSLDSIEGMVAKQDLAAGTIISTDLLYMPVYVRKGDAVTVRANAGGVSVSATMRAKEAGKFGDSIVVEHLSGNGTATARVVGPRTLEALQGAK